MRTSLIAKGFGSLLLLIAPASPQSAQLSSRAGETYEITQSYKTSEEASDGSSGSSSGSYTIRERILTERDGGFEIEYDLPPQSTANDRADNWQLPARVLKIPGRSMQLLNADQLERRLGDWLKAAKWDRSVCGRWIFTWNAFRIDCDPHSIIERVDIMNLDAQDLHEGAAYKDPQAIGLAHLARNVSASNGTTLRVTASVDPEKIKRQRAVNDVAVGEISQKPVSLESALRARSGEQVSGSISVVWEIDETGSARKRTKTTTVEIRRPDGITEKRMSTDIVERRQILQ
ncbi:hypothetical protein DD559_02265 [Sphingomonas pokkalii]|uniref:Uncharacterized protein n=1 Tax=Sphingomonas pokkalii TaxID=2175090 RepID=A0A2U0SA89_9SPHN|nr:hypothetical protein DD559_02265 [Sphingomonas pokkalii]